MFVVRYDWVTLQYYSCSWFDLCSSFYFLVLMNGMARSTTTLMSLQMTIVAQNQIIFNHISYFLSHIVTCIVGLESFSIFYAFKVVTNILIFLLCYPKWFQRICLYIGSKSHCYEAIVLKVAILQRRITMH